MMNNVAKICQIDITLLVLLSICLLGASLYKLMKKAEEEIINVSVLNLCCSSCCCTLVAYESNKQKQNEMFKISGTC